MAGPTYWDYLKLDQLLALQGGVEGDESRLVTDELHFIVVHQVYELWFKLMLSELRLARDHLAKPSVPEEQVPHVVHHLGRVSAIARMAIDQFGVMETLTPQDFLAFRDKLVPASGFQSFQMRELEILLGLEDDQRERLAGTAVLDYIAALAESSPAGAFAWGRIQAARNETTVKAALREWLYRTPVQGSSPGDDGDDAVVERFLADYLAAMERYHDDKVDRFASVPGADPEAVRTRLRHSADQARAFLTAQDVPAPDRARARRIRAGVLFIESYRELPLLAWPRLLIDSIVDLEEQLVLFRSRHARMVERIIGRRVGTGGSAGVDYLDATARYRVFDELWAVRSILLPKQALPPLRRAERYGFAS
ncbi:MAG: tryptophan 2,3-dioxygenase [Deltaproteobacteria bacterium]|nr:MAG: tryptophan 2,3-dioxygenase [Deltaproteobacteria bacterium]